MADSGRTIHLVDDDEAIRRAGSALLRTSGFVVRTYPSGEDLLARLADAAPGCILLDMRMPGMGGLDVQKALTARGLSWPVVVITGHGDIAMAVEAMKQGAVDFIEKPFEKERLLRALAAGFERLEESQGRCRRAEDAQARLRLLTPREREVLEGLVKGHPNKTVGYDLGISPRTVEIHRAHVMEKLGATSFSELLRVAFTAGLGDPDSVSARTELRPEHPLPA